MHRRIVLPSYVAVTLALVLTLAGCFSRQPASGPTSAPSSSLSSVAGDLIAKTGGYYTQEQDLHTAETRLTNSCLAMAGFHLPDTAIAPLSRDEEWRPDPAQRIRSGYGLLETLHQEGNGAAGPVTDYVRRLPADRQRQYEVALQGPANTNAALVLAGKQFTYPTRGCVADARTQIYGTNAVAIQVFFLPQMYYIDLLNKAHRDPMYANTMAEWSTCMEQTGYQYMNQQDARTQLLARYRSDPNNATTRQREIAIATADADCAARVHLGATTESLLRQGATSLPSADRDALTNVAAARASSAQRAIILIKSSSPETTADPGPTEPTPR